MSRVGMTGAAALLILSSAVSAGDWPQFRGPDSSAQADEAGLPTAWSADKNVAWKAKLPGVGWSSPVVVGDKVFLTTAVGDKQSKPRPGFGPAAEPPRSAVPGRRHAVCIARFKCRQAACRSAVVTRALAAQLNV